MPTIDTPTTAQSISGHLRPLPATGIKLNKQSLNVEQLSDHIIRVQHIDVEQLEKRYDTFLAEAILYLDPNSPSGFDRSWSIPGVKPEKHEAYATQWFAMAAIVLGLFLFLNLKRQHDV